MSVVFCLKSGSKSFSRDTGFPAALGDNGRVNLKSHCGDANVSELHTPMSNCLHCLVVSNLGLSEGVFGFDTTAQAFEVLGPSNRPLAKLISSL